MTPHWKGKKMTQHWKGKKMKPHWKGKKINRTDNKNKLTKKEKKQLSEIRIKELEKYLRLAAKSKKKNTCSKESDQEDVPLNVKRKLSAEANAEVKTKKEESDVKKQKQNTCSKESDQEGVPQNVKRKLSAEAYAEVKKRKKESDIKKQAWPRMFLNCLGELSSLTVDVSPHTPLYMNDIRHALLFCASLRTSPPRWIRIVRPGKFSHLVTVLVEGVSLTDILEVSKLSQNKHIDTAEPCNEVNAKLENGNTGMKMEEVSDNADMISNTKTQSENHCRPPKWLSEVLPRTSRCAHIKVEVTAPAKYRITPTGEFIDPYALHIKMKKRLFNDGELKIVDGVKETDVSVMELKDLFPIRPVEKIHNTLPESDKFDRRELLLSLEDLCRFGFPLDAPDCLGHKDSSFKYTSDCYSEVTQLSPMFAVDCEMCLTSIYQLEVTSISVVNEKLELVYHTLVKPPNPIINYLTQYSGITESMLENVTTRLPDVQEYLRKILPSDAILVGHSLDSDLKAIKMMHPYVIDSSLSYNLSYKRTLKTSLKNLVQEFLGEIIQDGTDGHDPSEDAAASLKLIKLKLQHDITFGNVLLEKKESGCTLADCENLNSQMDSETRNVENNSTRKDIFEFGKKGKMALLMTPSCKKSYDAECTRMENISVEVLPGIKHVSKRAAEIAIQNDFTLVHMKMDQKLEESQSCEQRRHHLRKLDKRLGRIIKSSASKALFVFLFTGSSLNVPEDKLSNGFAMIGIKDFPFRS